MIRKVKNFFHLLEAFAANLYYMFPSRKIFVIGVTGTDGKTTTTSLICHILNKSGRKAAMISSVGANIGNKQYDVGFHVTTPSSWGLQKYIKKAVDAGARYLILETTSHGLDQNRVFGVRYRISVVTNITHEHLDYHKTYEDYVNAKLKILKRSGVAVLNIDDESYNIISSKLKAQTVNSKLETKRFITYGLGENANINPKNFRFNTNLIGEFNRYNSLAAIAVCKNLGLEDNKIRSALVSFKPPIGREEIIYDKEFKIMIDFAHTPNAFYKILPEARKLVNGRLIHVFGSAGRRDETKRPLMGEASAKYSNIIILTAEDPRDEPVEKIIEQLAYGIKISNFQFRAAGKASGDARPNPNDFSNINFKFQKNKKYVFRIPDRKKAIEFAISIAQKGDLVICTGKSHEKSMNLGKGEEPWDEFKVCYDALRIKK